MKILLKKITVMDKVRIEKNPQGTKYDRLRLNFFAEKVRNFLSYTMLFFIF